MADSQDYIAELAGVVALPSTVDCSLITFASRIRQAILCEQEKICPNNALIALLADSARIGYEFGYLMNKII